MEIPTTKGGKRIERLAAELRQQAAHHASTQLAVTKATGEYFERVFDTEASFSDVFAEFVAHLYDGLYRDDREMIIQSLIAELIRQHADLTGEEVHYAYVS